MLECHDAGRISLFYVIIKVKMVNGYGTMILEMGTQSVNIQFTLFIKMQWLQWRFLLFSKAQDIIMNPKYLKVYNG